MEQWQKAKIKPTACALFPIGRLMKIEGSLENINTTDTLEIQYILNKPGCGDDSKTHTVREWLGEFGLPLQDAYYIKWTQTIIQAGMLLRKLEKECPEDIMEKIWMSTYVWLYLNYDIKDDFESQFDWNTTNVLEFLNKILKRIGDDDEHTGN